MKERLPDAPSEQKRWLHARPPVCSVARFPAYTVCWVAPHAGVYATTTEAFVERWEPFRDAFDIFLADGLPLRTPASALAVELRLGPALLDRKIVALRAQSSQTTALIAALGEERVRDWWSTETFVCADVVESRARTWGTWQVAA